MNNIQLDQVLETFIKNHKELVTRRVLMPYYSSEQQDPNQFWEEMRWKIESDNRGVDFIIQTQRNQDIVIDVDEIDRQRELEDHQNDNLDTILNAQYVSLKRKWRYLVTWTTRENGLKPNASWVQDDFLYKKYPDKLYEFLTEHEQTALFEQYVTRFSGKNKMQITKKKQLKE